MNNEFPINVFLSSNSMSSDQNIQQNQNITLNELDNLMIQPVTPKVSEPEDHALLTKELQNWISKYLPEEKYKTYFENINIVKLGQTTVYFTVKTPFIKSIIEVNYIDLLKLAIKSLIAKDLTIDIRALENDGHQTDNGMTNDGRVKNIKDIRFTIPNTESEFQSKIDTKYVNFINQSNNILIDTKKTFDNFIVGPSNNMAYAAAVHVSNYPGNQGKYPCLYFYSNSGLGKTHLLHAVANTIREKNPTYTICFTSAQQFMSEMINALQEKKFVDFLKKYTEKVDILMIDDIHTLSSREGTQNQFFFIFNELYNKGKQLIFTSDKAPSEIEGLEDRIKTRLQWGLVVDIQQPDLETRIAILKRKAKELELYLTEELINLVALSVKSNIRELEGSLIRLSAYAEIAKVEIDEDIVREQLMLGDGEDNKLTIDSIAKSTAKHFKISVADIKAKSRNKEFTLPRHIAMYLSQKILSVTLKDIGRYYGGRDHTSVIHAIDKIKLLSKTDKDISKHVLAIENSIN